jgi:hypothetical protein
LLNVNPLMAAGVEWAIYLATLLFFVLSIVIYATCFFGDAFESSRSVGREKGSEQ